MNDLGSFGGRVFFAEELIVAHRVSYQTVVTYSISGDCSWGESRGLVHSGV